MRVPQSYSAKCIPYGPPSLLQQKRFVPASVRRSQWHKIVARCFFSRIIIRGQRGRWYSSLRGSGNIRQHQPSSKRYLYSSCLTPLKAVRRACTRSGTLGRRHSRLTVSLSLSPRPKRSKWSAIAMLQINELCLPFFVSVGVPPPNSCG